MISSFYGQPRATQKRIVAEFHRGQNGANGRKTQKKKKKKEDRVACLCNLSFLSLRTHDIMKTLYIYMRAFYQHVQVPKRETEREWHCFKHKGSLCLTRAANKSFLALLPRTNKSVDVQGSPYIREVEVNAQRSRHALPSIVYRSVARRNDVIRRRTDECNTLLCSLSLSFKRRYCL